VGDEVLAGLAPLIGVALTREREGALDRVAIDFVAAVRSVLPDHRKEVAEQLPLVGVEVLGDLVDRRYRPGRVGGADLDVTTPDDPGRRGLGPL
jgi:hypothetical protein